MLQEAQRTSAPERSQRLDQHRRLGSSCGSEPVIRAPFSGFDVPNSSARGHQAGHLGFSDIDFLAAIIGECDYPRRHNPCRTFVTPFWWPW